MTKIDTMTTDELIPLTDNEIDAVNGGMDLKGASDALTQRTQQMFQQIMQQLTQGQG